jgi:hypothetical protein
MKTCRKCNLEKSTAEFYNSKTATDKLTSWCKPCTIASAKKTVNGTTLTEYQRTWRNRNPQKRRKFYLQSYGLTVEQYDAKLEQQNHSCAICKLPTTQYRRALSVDHNHETKIVRGLLCDSCNLLIGHAKEQVSILKNAISYLETFS